MCYTINTMDFSIIGLNNRDKRVYEALLLEPMSSVRGLAEQTSINRGSVFESIKSLQAIGMVSYVKVGTRHKYTAESPEKLHEIINEKRRELRDTHSAVDDYVSFLQPQVRSRDVVPHFAAFYEGQEGVASVLRDVLTTCRLQKVTEYRVVSSPRVSEYMYHNYPHFTRERVKQELYVRILRQGKPLRGEAEVSERRYLADKADNGAYTLIYGSKLATISINEFNQLSAVVIDNPGVANSHAAVFDQAWLSSEVL
ncbi:MAG: Transcriptional regulator, TrmB [Candidatus Saccharibacteria bacterium GW2011_GWC2_48_9]|nr:MAG: Transcriptional regulator, TrmB [Candidatus Saccharibacteria bacterium GW2011_GWC2_48_9]